MPGFALVAQFNDKVGVDFLTVPDIRRRSHRILGMISGLSLLHVLQRVVACELVAAAEGLEHRRPLEPGAGVARMQQRVREVVEPWAGDRPLTPDIERVAALAAREALV